MKYYTVDYKGNLKEMSRKETLKDMQKDRFIVYEDSEYTLISDSANSEEILKNAILQMLQDRIYFDVCSNYRWVGGKLEKITKEVYYSLEETYLMALRCVEDNQIALNSLAECRNEEEFNTIEVMIDFIESEENDIFTFIQCDVEGDLLYTWERK